MTAVFGLPLVALVVIRYVRGDLEARGLAWRLGVLLAIQLWLSTEFALTVTLMLAFGLLVRRPSGRIQAPWLCHPGHGRAGGNLRLLFEGLSPLEHDEAA